ncbi:AAA family ATPase [Thiomicrospira microaerophila]|uniref:AAA family ATPase n=1 Tax=Thiomicrospira microaerophila TaxID=406020 RepID=UPI0005C83828|nr:ATP-binding protein [Thiomicrospira microaerophila]
MRINAGGLSTIVVGREREIKTIKSYIKMGQHCAIVAPRRYGKTTLVNAVLEDLKNDYLIIKLDIFAASNVRELCHLLIDAVYQSHGVSNFVKSAKDNILDIVSRFKLDTDFVKIGYDLLREPSEAELIKKAFQLPDLFAEKQNKRAIVFMDEFGDIERFGEDVVKKLRAYFQTHQHVSYIFAGSQTSVMNKVFLDKANAFFNFASIMNLPLLDIDQCRTFAKGLRIDHIQFNEQAVEKILETTQGHPYYFIKLIQEAYVLAYLDDSSLVTPDLVDKAIQKILRDNHAFFEVEWDRINVKKHKGHVLKSLIGLDTVSEQVSLSYKSQMIKELKNEAVLNNEKQMTDPLFKAWLIRNIAI